MAANMWKIGLAVALLFQLFWTTTVTAQDKPVEEVKVTTILEKPFVMLDKSGKFEGYIVDMMDLIADIVRFKYKLQFVRDGRYGAPSRDGKTWTGMVGELMDKKVDMAAAPLTITSMRSRVIEFSKPFMNLGTTLIMKKPVRSRETSMFAILQPFETGTWVAIVIAYAVMSVALFLFGRFSEWQQIPDSQTERNRFSCANSAWFLFGFPGKAGLPPSSLAVRIIGAVWWIFSFFVFATYVALLSSSIGIVTAEKMILPIQSASDLAQQTEVKYGTIAGGSTMQFFRTSRIPTYQKMWQFMSTQKPSVFVNTTKEGIKRATRGNYAFITESTTVDYVINRECSLMRVGGLLDQKGFGLAFPKESKYRVEVNLALLQLQENGNLYMLYSKWFRNNGICNNDKKEETAAIRHHALGIADIRGAFVILVIGVILAVAVSVFECFYRSFQRSNDKKSKYCDQFSSDIRKSFGSCCASTREVTPPPEEKSAP